MTWAASSIEFWANLAALWLVASWLVHADW